MDINENSPITEIKEEVYRLERAIEILKHEYSSAVYLDPEYKRLKTQYDSAVECMRWKIYEGINARS